MIALTSALLLAGCASAPDSDQPNGSQTELASDESTDAKDASEESTDQSASSGGASNGGENGAVSQRAERFTERVEKRLTEGAGPKPGASEPPDRGPRQSSDQSRKVKWSPIARKSPKNGSNRNGSTANDSTPQAESAQAQPKKDGQSPPIPMRRGANAGAAAEQTGDSQPPQRAAEQEQQDSEAQRRPLPQRSPKQLAKQLREMLTGRGKRDRRSFRPWLGAAAMTLIDPSEELTKEDLSGLSAGRRELVLAYQRTFTQLGRQLGQGAEPDRQQLHLAAQELHDQLRQQRSLTIRNPHLCKRVRGYGVYETFDDNEFVAGVTQPVIVYVELDHFTPKHEDGRYTVKLNQKIVLYNASDGLAVWRVDPTRIADTSRNRRRDFFVVQTIRLPDRLTVGKYMLKVTVTDKIGHEVDEATIPLRIVAEKDAEGQQTAEADR